MSIVNDKDRREKRMNEKIEELISQAYVEISHERDNTLVEVFDKRLFAELIINKCADIVKQMDSNRTETFHRIGGEQVHTCEVLKKYFGITE